MQVRKADLGKPDLAARTVPLVLATDHPVQRSGYVEVLDIARVDLSRGDLPLIESHDTGRLNIGVIRNIRAEGNKLRGEAVFGTSARASEVLADVMAGVVTGVSIGYQLTDEGQPITLADGTAATAFGFLPYECSLVAVPADPNAGFNRSRPTLSLPRKTPIMSNETTSRPNMGSRDAAEIVALGEAHASRGGVELAMRFIRERRGLQEFRDALLDAPIQTRETVAFRPGEIGRATASLGSGGATLGDQLVRAFAENADLFNRTKSLTMQLRAAGDTITTASGRTIVTGAAGFISGGVLGLQNALRVRGADGSALEYSRFTGTQGAAAVQAAEGDAKAAVRPDHSLIVQSALTIAGYAQMSRQALKDSDELRRAVDVTLARSVATALDAALVNGCTGFTGGFEGLATAYTSLTYTALVDAVSEAVATMQTAGFNPDVVSLHPSDWLAITTAKGTANDHYLSGSYLAQIEPVLRGLRVVLSPSVDAGKALVLDSSHSELLIVEDFNVELGYVNDNFTKNLAVVLGEMRVLPVFRTVGSARLITPKA